VVNAMLFRDGDLKRLPRGHETAPPQSPQRVLPQEPPSCKPSPACGCLEHGRGFNLMFAESQILAAILLRLIERRHYGASGARRNDGRASRADRATH